MHFHLPKPLHGWREFIGEVGIIVVGVLIALGAEQVIEELHWKNQVEAGGIALRQEVKSLVANADERQLQSHCLGTRLSQIAAILQLAAEIGHLPPVGPIASPSIRLWWLSSWDGLVASQTSLHMPRDEMLAYSDLSRFALIIGEENRKEVDDWSTLHTIVGPGRPFGDAEQASVRAALAHTIYSAKVMKLGSGQLRANIAKTHLLSKDDLAIIAKETRANMQAAQRSGRTNRCGPIGPAPAQYDSSPIDIQL